MLNVQNSVPVLPDSSHNTKPLPSSLAQSSPGCASIPKPAFLVSLTKSGLRQVAPVSAMIVLGSAPEAGIRLQDPTVNSRHARIEQRGQQWMIRDLQSPQGVWVNDTRVSEAPLEDLDRIRIGECILQFRIGLDEEPTLSSKNEEWNKQLGRLSSFAQTDFPVLMLGPSGSGKEVIARSIHRMSRRKNGAFVAINCGALSESLIESELFGHVKGSFTGASHDRKGAFESARGGTLVLDEVGDLPLALQAKLLRALENKEIRPVGSDRTIETDVRVLASTHKDLALMVAQGRFREDLYWRLNVCRIQPPALKERMEDFVDLVYFFCKEMRVRLSFNTIEKLKTHTWPGNIRELRNVIARGAAYFPGQNIQPEDLEILLDIHELPARISGLRGATEALQSALERGQQEKVGLPSGALSAGGSVMREIEREMIIRRLVANHGNQRKTAADLGMPKSTLHDRLKSYSIDLEEIKGASNPSA
jgi:DNA-binding NtrC family response regulator